MKTTVFSFFAWARPSRALQDYAVLAADTRLSTLAEPLWVPHGDPLHRNANLGGSLGAPLGDPLGIPLGIRWGILLGVPFVVS